MKRVIYSTTATICPARNQISTQLQMTLPTLTQSKIVFALIVLLVALLGGLWPFLKKAHSLNRDEMSKFTPCRDSLKK